MSLPTTLQLSFDKTTLDTKFDHKAISIISDPMINEPSFEKVSIFIVIYTKS